MHHTVACCQNFVHKLMNNEITIEIISYIYNYKNNENNVIIIMTTRTTTMIKT